MAFIRVPEGIPIKADLMERQMFNSRLGGFFSYGAKTASVVAASRLNDA